MTVDARLQEKWQVLRSKGDSLKIATFAAARGHDVTEQGVSHALRTGKMSDELFKVIADFYQQKAELMAAYI